MKQIEIGQRVMTLVGKTSYYNEGFLSVGAIGFVGAVNCPKVCGRGVFQCVDFMLSGKRVRASYNLSELENAQV
jgi:hypothetical protein